MRIRTPIRPVTGIEVRKTYWPHLLTILLLWFSAMTLDFYDQKIQAENVAAQHERDFTECLKGKWRTVTDDGTEWGCLPVQANKKITK
jgi:hypothetical protein